MSVENSFLVYNRTKNALPNRKSVYLAVKNAILGKDYQLDLVFTGEKKSRSLNLSYRKKNRPTDTLAFPLSKDEGEIFINPKRAKINAKKFSRSYENFILFLFIHSLCHLKGMAHGSKMEATEKKFRARFGV